MLFPIHIIYNIAMPQDIIRTIRQQFFALRNGIIAETLRKAGDSHKVIFGLNLPQLTQIASTLPQDKDLALKLFGDTNCRECQLLASMVMPKAAITQAECFDMCKDINDYEVADIMCHKLFSKLPFAGALQQDLFNTGDDLPLYISLRLLQTTCNRIDLDKIALLADSNHNPRIKRLASIVISNLE